MKKKTVYRSIDSTRGLAIDQDARTVEMSFASDFPVTRYDWIEVLDVAGMDMSRIGSGGAAFLVEHDRRDQVGVIESVSVGSDNIARAKVRFGRSARAQEIFQDIVDGIRTLVSFGYSIDKIERTGEEEGKPIFTVSKFTPFEISTVSIPADYSIGVGRAADMAPLAEDLPGTQADVETTDTTDENKRELEKPAAEVIRSANPHIETITREVPKMDPIQIERQRTADILALGAKFKADEAARAFIADGKSVDEFRAHLLETHKPEPVRTAAAGISDAEAGNFSLLRLLHARASGDWSKAGFERAACAAAAKSLGRTAKGDFVPLEVMVTRASQHNVGAAADGGALVATELRTENFIEKLQSRLMVRAMGATMLDGLQQGNVAFPKETGLMGVAWVGEDGTASNTKAAFGQVPMSPKTVLAKTSISRRLMIQSSLSVEAFVRGRLQKAIALAIDKAALIGGGANEPVGLLGGGLGAGRKVVVGADYSWAEIVALETLVAVADADIGALGYLTNATVRGSLKTTEKATGSGQFIWGNGANGLGELNGYRAGVTSQLSGVQSIFGNWADLLIGLYSGTDIVVDATSADDGSHIVKVYQDADVAIAREESFAYGAAA